MRFCIILSIFLFTTNILISEEADNSKKETETEKITIWEGEISAIYKEKGKVRALIPVDPNWTGTNFEEIKEKIMDMKDFPIRQKITKKKIGIFEVRDVEFERSIEKKGNKPQEFQVMIYGKLKLRKKSYFKTISNDFYISMSKEETIYTDPSVFYKQTVTPPAVSIIHAKDRKEMVIVPSGVFIHGQGKDGDQDDFNPAFMSPDFSTLVDLPSYYIDKYEVTNQEYDRFLRETGYKSPHYWPNGNIPEGKENHPVISLSYRDVETYATWAGKRIPTELEWEKAARGMGVTITRTKKDTYIFDLQTQRFPFGEKFDSTLCNSLESGIGDTVSVYELSTKGASPYGAIGMCGNAAEWTSSWYDAYEGHRFNSPVVGKTVKVIRGGSFTESQKRCSVHYRTFGGLPNLREDRRAGFRLVQDLRN
jgi:formylglycine-generating enzyme required for sulfatase activity